MEGESRADTRCVSELILGRVRERYPTPGFVSVKSGTGYIPFPLDSLDSLDWRRRRLRLHRTDIARSDRAHVRPGGRSKSGRAGVGQAVPAG